MISPSSAPEEPIVFFACSFFCRCLNEQARLSAGAVSLEQTKAWLSSAVEGFLSAETGEGGTGDEGERARRAKGLLDGREVKETASTTKVPCLAWVVVRQRNVLESLLRAAFCVNLALLLLLLH